MRVKVEGKAEFDRFDNFMRRLVPHSEMKAALDAEKKAKKRTVVLSRLLPCKGDKCRNSFRRNDDAPERTSPSQPSHLKLYICEDTDAQHFSKAISWS